ncbi:MAG: histidine kinase, partial [Anaerolinea sp.]|nr:histidine kinase [Anaerolinea sp.]
IRPENAPDTWETEALEAFERGETEDSSLQEMEGEEYMRLMRPLITESGCLKCHAAQGYKEGDIRGGISVAIPMSPLQAVAGMQVLTLAGGHILLWLMGLGGIVLGAQRLRRSEWERERAAEELRKYAGQLEQANIRLQEMDRLKSVFLASMSHELRTPLNSIIGFTGIILQGMTGEITEEQRKQLTMVKNSGSHLLSLINDLLDISKIEAGKVELSLKEFSLDDVVREVVEAFSPAVSEKGLELTTQVPEGSMLFSEKRRIKQILMNLVSNAIKFTDQGSVQIVARILEGENLETRVIDTGIGIKREDMSKLFEPFQQIDVPLTKSRQGTGLGLYLTKKLVTLLGGNISAKSEYGRGSEFTFTIPLQYKEEQKSEKDTSG